MTLDEAFALAAEVAHPDFLPHYAAMIDRERLLRAIVRHWLSSLDVEEWEVLHRCSAQVTAILDQPVVLPS